MRIIKEKITKAELSVLTRELFGDFVKAVVDVEKEIMAVGGSLHADEEAVLLQEGCEQKNLWGINIYPEKEQDDWVEFDSMINVKPMQENRSRGIESPETRKRVMSVVKKLVQ